MFDLVLAYMFVYFEEWLRDYLLFEVARSQIGCDVWCLFVWLLRQTVKFLANEESVTDAGRQTVTFAPLSIELHHQTIGNH